MRTNPLKPAQTRVRNIAVTEKARAIEVKQGETPTIEFDMRDEHGQPLDLTEYGFQTAEEISSASADSASSSSGSESEEPQICLLVGEFLKGGASALAPIAGTVVSATAGTVQAEIPALLSHEAGIYAAEFSVVQADGNVCGTNNFYLHILRGLRGRNSDGVRRGPPTAAEIRLHLRDSAPEESYLLDTLAWDAAELAEAVAACVDVWNEMLPPIRTYTTKNFPYRINWINGVIAILYRMAAEWYARNDMQYQTAGVAVNDMAKSQWYQTEGAKKWEEYKKWVQGQKIAANIAGGFGSVESSYRRTGGGLY
jgi:hypothetical protein